VARRGDAAVKTANLGGSVPMSALEAAALRIRYLAALELEA
jgi:hypothetical protein